MSFSNLKVIYRKNVTLPSHIRNLVKSKIHEWKCPIQDNNHYDPKATLENQTLSLLNFLYYGNSLLTAINIVYCEPMNNRELTACKAWIENSKPFSSSQSNIKSEFPKPEPKPINLSTNQRSIEDLSLLDTFSRAYSKDVSEHRFFKRKKLNFCKSWHLVLIHAIDRDSKWTTRLFSKNGRSRTSRILVDMGLITFENGNMTTNKETAKNKFEELHGKNPVSAKFISDLNSFLSSANLISNQIKNSR